MWSYAAPARRTPCPSRSGRRRGILPSHRRATLARRPTLRAERRAQAGGCGGIQHPPHPPAAPANRGSCRPPPALRAVAIAGLAESVRCWLDAAPASSTRRHRPPPPPAEARARPARALAHRPAAAMSSPPARANTSHAGARPGHQRRRCDTGRRSVTDAGAPGHHTRRRASRTSTAPVRHRPLQRPLHRHARTCRTPAREPDTNGAGTPPAPEPRLSAGANGIFTGRRPSL